MTLIVVGGIIGAAVYGILEHKKVSHREGARSPGYGPRGLDLAQPSTVTVTFDPWPLRLDS